MSVQRERIFIMIKPDGVHRGLIGKIIDRFERKGFKLVALKYTWPSEDLVRQHYSDLSSLPFFPDLVKYTSSGPVVPMVWEGLNVVKSVRQMIGRCNPADMQPGTIRGDFCIQIGRSVIHASDSMEAATKEIGLWFTEEQIVGWIPAVEEWVYGVNENT